MKKLLALLLCVMLFVSIVPASAFAASEGNAVSLYPAVEKMQSLDNAYAQFAAAYVINNGYKGFMEMSKILGPNAGTEAAEEAENLASYFDIFIDHVKSLKTGMSYEGLYILFIPELMYHFNEATEDVGEDIAAVYETAQGNLDTAISNLEKVFE